MTGSHVQACSISSSLAPSNPRTGPERPVAETTPTVAGPESAPFGLVKSSERSETVSPA